MRAIQSILFLFLSISAQAQNMSGLVLDDNSRPLNGVTVTNVSAQRAVLTDSVGYYSIPAKPGERISYTYYGYRTVLKTASDGGVPAVVLKPLSVQLKEQIVRDLTPFQRDSIEMTEMYGKELNKKPVKAGYSSANGGGFTGIIGGPVQKISRSYKQNKRFREQFNKDMEQKYIDTRYTQRLVNAITGYTGDNLAIFMNTYPMDYGFARTATELELKMWIQENFKDYKRKGH